MTMVPDVDALDHINGQSDQQQLDESQASDLIDCAEAFRLLAAGQSLKTKHRGAVARLRSRIFQEEAAKLKQKDLCSLMGVAATQLNSIENKFGLPVGGGRQLNLSAILKALKKFLDENEAKLKAGEETDDEKLAKRKKEIEIAKLEEQIKKIQINNAKAEGSVIDRAETELMLNRLATVLRSLGETLSKRHSMPGREAKQLIDAALNSLKKEIES